MANSSLLLLEAGMQPQSLYQGVPGVGLNPSPTLSRGSVAHRAAKTRLFPTGTISFTEPRGA